jgi:hypothetical protein
VHGFSDSVFFKFWCSFFSCPFRPSNAFAVTLSTVLHGLPTCCCVLIRLWLRGNVWMKLIFYFLIRMLAVKIYWNLHYDLCFSICKVKEGNNTVVRQIKRNDRTYKLLWWIYLIISHKLVWILIDKCNARLQRVNEAFCSWFAC